MTLDSATSARCKLIYPDVAVKAKRVYEDMWRIHLVKMRMMEGLRTFERQTALFAQGRTTQGPGATAHMPLGRKVTNSKAGESLHHYGCAFDSCFVGPDPFLESLGKTDPKKAQHLWAEFGRIAEAHGLEWGGNWVGLVDRPHSQYRYGFSNQDIREFYRFGGMKAVWSRFDLKRDVPIGHEWYGPQPRAKMVEMGQLVD